MACAEAKGPHADGLYLIAAHLRRSTKEAQARFSALSAQARSIAPAP